MSYYQFWINLLFFNFIHYAFHFFIIPQLVIEFPHFYKNCKKNKAYQVRYALPSFNTCYLSLNHITLFQRLCISIGRFWTDLHQPINPVIYILLSLCFFTFFSPFVGISFYLCSFPLYLGMVYISVLFLNLLRKSFYFSDYKILCQIHR